MWSVSGSLFSADSEGPGGKVGWSGEEWGSGGVAVGFLVGTGQACGDGG